MLIDSTSLKSYTDHNLVNGTLYSYKVTAVDNDNNESAYSNIAQSVPNEPFINPNPFWYVAKNGSDLYGVGSMKILLAQFKKE